MLSRVNNTVWDVEGKQGGGGEGEETFTNKENNTDGGVENKEDMELGVLSTFKSMLDGADVDWYMNSNNNMQNHTESICFTQNFTELAENSLFLQTVPVDSSSSCSPSSVSVFNNLDPSQVHYFLTQKAINNNPLDYGFNLGCENGFLEAQGMGGLNKGGFLLTGGGFHDFSSQNQMGNPNLNSFTQYPSSHLPQISSAGFSPLGFADGSANENPLLLNRSKLLKPLDNFASIGAQPTLFQKRAALRKNLANNGGGSLGD